MSDEHHSRQEPVKTTNPKDAPVTSPLSEIATKSLTEPILADPPLPSALDSEHKSDTKREDVATESQPQHLSVGEKVNVDAVAPEVNVDAVAPEVNVEVTALLLPQHEPTITVSPHELATASPPKAATWTIQEPTQPWCPSDLEKTLGFSIDYQNELNVNSVTMPNWLVAAATKRGRMHAHHGTHREDAFAFRKEKHFSIDCVCDGAGSSKLSRIGSEYTCRNLCKLVGDELLANEVGILKCSQESLRANLNNVLLHGVVAVAGNLTTLATEAGYAAKDMRCTVLTVLQYHHPSGGVFVFGNVGDGFLAVKRKGQPAERLGSSDSGAFSGEVTCFMPDPKIGDFYKASIESIDPVPEMDAEAIILCTDGIEDPFFPIHRTISELYLQLEDGFKSPINDVIYPQDASPQAVFRASNPSEELSKWLGFEKRGENDDRTIMVVYHNSIQTAKPKEITPADEKVTDRGQEDADKASENHSFPPAVLLTLIMLGAILLAIISFWFGYKFGKSESQTDYSSSYHQHRHSLVRGLMRFTSVSSLQATPSV